ncbi:MAG: ABC transporter ATP-binding protein [Sphaerochaeta sp.]|nr:ABC transporter ATP-binding protein [Sphaerochaeta sp.]
MALLEITGLVKKFGGLTAVDHVDLIAEKQKITGLIGPNGAGKTTLFNMVGCTLPVTEGKIVFDGRLDLTKMAPHKLVYEGITRTFQIEKLFKKMSVLENIMAAYYPHTRTNLASAILGLPIVKREELEVRAKAIELVEEFGLGSILNVLAGNLSTGQQRLVEIMRAVAGKPKLLMLDEPAAGLNTIETENLLIHLRKLNENGLSLLIIEHNMKFMMRLADYIYVLNFGKLIAKGNPSEVCNDAEVVKAYLGKEYRHA